MEYKHKIIELLKKANAVQLEAIYYFMRGYLSKNLKEEVRNHE